MEDTANLGETAARPWDVVLGEDVIATINDTLPGLCMGEETPEDFQEAVDEALEANAEQIALFLFYKASPDHRSAFPFLLSVYPGIIS